VSGGSTITMQLARIMRKNPSRTFFEKIYEMILATRLEIRYSKHEILGEYAAHAPFGNNVVGLEAASWRYFGRGPEQLSWAESATLAVLPNAPGLIYPGKNHQRLLEKRNRLLKRLYEVKLLDQTSYELALSEPLPERPLPLPREAPHLLDRLIAEGYKGQTIHSTLNTNLQTRTQNLVQDHFNYLKENRIYNAAVMITDVKTNSVLVYIGNTNEEEEAHGNEVDCIEAPRSTGSILKPFLFEKSMEDGLITPNMLLSDVPTQFGSFAPKNFSKQYDGAVTARQALARSLNIPMVRLLNDYGLEKFHRDLKQAGLSTLHQPARHYGLSLILGGAEAKLWDLSMAYLGMAQTLRGDKVGPAQLVKGKKYMGRKKPKTVSEAISDKACVYQTLEAMVEVNRPDEEGNWRVFNSAQKIAWKTGTSFGFRDGWAVGITPKYCIVVWVGNATGEGRPGLTGINTAAPVLFELFRMLPQSKWFQSLSSGFMYMPVCHESGFKAGPDCHKADTIMVSTSAANAPICPYHRIIHLDATGTYRVTANCVSPADMQHVSWFVLPPTVEYYYKQHHTDYKTLPPFMPGCSNETLKPLDIIYPEEGAKIYVPLEISGERGKTIFTATDRNSNAKLFWHLDEVYMGATTQFHKMAVSPEPGAHTLTVIDENGETVTRHFEILEKKKGNE